MTLTYEQVMEFLPAYAIGALDVGEQDAIDEYFRLQDELRQKLATAESATMLLAQDVDHAELPADAMDRLMARVGAEDEITDYAEDEATLTESVPESVPDSMVDFGAGDDVSHDDVIQDDVGRDDVSRDDVSRDDVSRENGHGEQAARQAIASPLTRKRVVQRPTASSEPRADRSADLRAGGSQAAAQAGSRRSTKASEPKSRPSFLFNMINGRALANAALVAAVAATVLLGGLSSQLYEQTRTLQEQAGVLRDENAALAETNEQIQSGRVALFDEYTDLEIVYEETALERRALYEANQLLQSQLDMDSERITLVGAASQATVMFGTDEAPGLQGTFFHKDEEGALVVHGLEPLPIDQTYQFWLVTEEGEQVSAGLFAVDANAEPTWANLELPVDVPPYSVVGVTIEPATGSTAPTGPMLLESGVDFAESSS